MTQPSIANAGILIAASVFDIVVLIAFLMIKATSDPLVLYASAVGLAMIFASEWWLLRWRQKTPQ